MNGASAFVDKVNPADDVRFKNCKVAIKYSNKSQLSNVVALKDEVEVLAKVNAPFLC